MKYETLILAVVRASLIVVIILNSVWHDLFAFGQMNDEMLCYVCFLNGNTNSHSYSAQRGDIPGTRYDIIIRCFFSRIRVDTGATTVASSPITWPPSARSARSRNAVTNASPRRT